MNTRTYALLLLPLFALLAVACGGGGGGDDNQVQQLTLTSTANLDGAVVFNNVGSTNTGSSIFIPEVGDGIFVASGGTLQRHGLWSFDISGLPAGATITGATLRLFQSGQAGNPDTAFVLARLDHVNYGAVFPTTFNAFVVLAADIDQVQNLNNPGGATNLDVATAVQADVGAARPRSQFRLRPAISTNNDAQADTAVFTDAENTANPAQLPMLIIEFTTN